MSLPAPHETLMYREAAEAADVIAAQFARNQVAVETLAASLRAAPPPFVVTCARAARTMPPPMPSTCWKPGSGW